MREKAYCLYYGLANSKIKSLPTVFMLLNAPVKNQHAYIKGKQIEIPVRAVNTPYINIASKIELFFDKTFRTNGQINEPKIMPKK